MNSQSHILSYLNSVKEKFNSGEAKEHSYRSCLENYLNSIYGDKFLIINEPKRQKCGAPDLIIKKKISQISVPIGYIEAKDIGKNLDDLDFIFYKDGEKYERVQIAKIEDKKLVFLEENFPKLENLLQNFTVYLGQNITNSKDLASIMAKKAKLMRDSFANALDLDYDTGIKSQLKAFKEVLIHDITNERFANIYAQTIAYGLFTARFFDESLEDFSREESYNLIPKSNPFLRQLFKYVAIDIEDEIEWSVNELCEVFRLCNLPEILANFGKKAGRTDPIIHFYEDFLKEFDPEIRKSRGVFYTPEAIVNFIVRGVDEILKKEFLINDGIADISKTKITLKNDQYQKGKNYGKKTYEKEIHKVQLLDVATGTGTFTAEIIHQIYQNYYQGQEGMWSDYVENDLLPRLHGFEILMASYAMCHLKIDLLLNKTGYKAKNDKNPQRLGVYLTNALEESHKDHNTLFASFLSNEANAAAKIKKEMPVMVAMGNPPYAVSSQNKGEWIGNLIKDYKKDLNEKKINLDDDYIKFIRMAEYQVSKTGYGIVAMITNNSFIDGITHRQMRKHLLETFDKIYIIDLHGNSKKKETSPGGSKDENVFDIMQGVSINFFIKNNTKNKDLAEVFHFDLYGRRKEKYQKLLDNKLENIGFKKLAYKEPYYFFVPKDFQNEEEYEAGFKINELMKVNNSGIKTDRDNLFIDDNKDNLLERFQVLLSGNYSEEFKEKYRVKDSGSYKITQVIKGKIFNSGYIKALQYRPFDYKNIYYDPAIISRPASKVMENLNSENIILNTARTLASNLDWNRVFISNVFCDVHTIGDQNYCLPLYLYNSSKSRTPNLNLEIINQISSALNLQFIIDHNLKNDDNKNSFTPLDILDYIYATLHSPAYRKKYQEFLKIDFPRVPYPKNSNQFWKLVKIGGQIRKSHLMEGDDFEGIKNLITKYPIGGTNKVDKISVKSFVTYYCVCII